VLAENTWQVAVSDFRRVVQILNISSEKTPAFDTRVDESQNWVRRGFNQHAKQMEDERSGSDFAGNHW
jgi:hypothetical protein